MPKVPPPVKSAIHQARNLVRSNLDSGVECPCCGQFCKIYRRKLNSGMARALIWIVKRGQLGELWIDIPRTAPSYVVQNRDYAKLVHWGLITTKSNTNSAKRTSGLWRATLKGIDFVLSGTEVPSRVHLYNNQVIGFSEEKITIVDALGDRFNYQQLMNE